MYKHAKKTVYAFSGLWKCQNDLACTKSVGGLQNLKLDTIWKKKKKRKEEAMYFHLF